MALLNKITQKFCRKTRIFSTQSATCANILQSSFMSHHTRTGKRKNASTRGKRHTGNEFKRRSFKVRQASRSYAMSIVKWWGGKSCQRVTQRLCESKEIGISADAPLSLVMLLPKIHEYKVHCTGKYHKGNFIMNRVVNSAFVFRLLR